MGLASHKSYTAIGAAGCLLVLAIVALHWNQRSGLPASELNEVRKLAAARTILADEQKTKVELLLGEGKYDQALTESKRY